MTRLTPALAVALDDADDLRDRLKVTSDALNEARNEIDVLCIRLRRQRDVSSLLRRQVADLAEERDVLVRQLVAIRAMVTAPGGFYIADLQQLIDGAHGRTIHEVPR